MNYQVTLAMPVYNVEKYVEKALLSALNQTFPNIEYLIIDDKGQDKSMEIVHRIISEHPRGKDVRIIDHIVNQGTGATKNSAIEEAQSKYLFFMDSDDEITPDCIQILYNKMQENPVDVVIGSYHIPSIKDVGTLPDKKLNSNNEILEYVYKEKSPFYIYTWNKLYNISFLRENKIRCVPYHTCEDNIFTFDLLMKATSITLLSNITYIYYQYDNSFMGNLRTIGFSEKVAQMHSDIIEHKIEICRQFSPQDKGYITVRVYYQAVWYMLCVLNSKLSLKIKFQNIRRMKGIFCLNLPALLSFKQRIIFYILKGNNNLYMIFLSLSLCNLILKIKRFIQRLLSTKKSNSQ